MASALTRATPATADIAAAQRRSTHYGLNPATTEVPNIGDPGPAAEGLTRLSAPVLDHLLAQIVDSSLAVVMADRDGRLTRRDAMAPATLAAMDERNLDLGFSLAEPAVGTNGVGTSLETKKPAIVVGANHFLESFKPFTCANAPIIGPITGRVEGTVGVMCPAEDTGPLLLPTAVRLASQISDLLLEQATPEERFLLEQFLRRRQSHRNAVAAIGQGVLIASPAAQRLLADLDHTELWERIEVGIRDTGSFEAQFDRPSRPPVTLRCRPLHRGGEVQGATVEFVTAQQPSRSPERPRRRERLGDLVGESDSWQDVVRDALIAVRSDEPVLIMGERGTGRLSIAEAIARQRGATLVDVLDPADLLIDGARDWVLRAQRSVAQGNTLILRRIDQLPEDVASALANLVADPATTRVFATAEAAVQRAPALAGLLDQLKVFQIDVPPLRNRRDDIAPLVRHFATQYERTELDQDIVNVLYRQSWRGNVTELRQTLRSASARAMTGMLSVQHLPRHIRQEHNRKPLHGLRQQEADAILAAINSTATRADAAKQLGISRATLFRRINAYGLDPDRS